MSTKYCGNCGFKHTFTIDIPRFCNQCGKPFGGAEAEPIAKKEITAKRVEKKPLDGEGEDEDLDREVPQISKIEVEIEPDYSPKMSFANVKNAASFAREKPSKELSTKDLETRLDTLFQRDRENQKE